MDWTTFLTCLIINAALWFVAGYSLYTTDFLWKNEPLAFDTKRKPINRLDYDILKRQAVWVCGGIVTIVVISSIYSLLKGDSVDVASFTLQLVTVLFVFLSYYNYRIIYGHKKK